MKSVVPRRDGFRGQHMIVLPDPLRAVARRHPLLQGLHVTDAGYFPCAAHHLVERPRGAATVLVILCLRGHGWVQFTGERMAAPPGTFLWLPAQRAHAYGAAEVDPWTIAWAHFAGEEVAAWRELLGFTPAHAAHSLPLPVDRLDEVALDQVHPALERGYAIRELVAAAAALRQALSAVARLGVSGSGAMRPARERVSASIATLRRDWQRPHRLAELAAAAALSPAHYSALFRLLTGFAPIDYVIRLRIQHACRLLDTTMDPIATVAAAVGYDDPYYFTRCFRRVMACSPRAYRRVTKG